MARKYDVLRQEHQTADKAPIERDKGPARQPAQDSIVRDSEPTRPSAPARQSLQWTDAGGMVQHHASANAAVKSANRHRMQQAADRAADRSPPNDNPGRSADARSAERSREPTSRPTEQEKIEARRALNAEHANARSLSFAKDREARSADHGALKRENAKGEPAKTQAKSLSFARDRADPGRDYGR